MITLGINAMLSKYKKTFRRSNSYKQLGDKDGLLFFFPGMGSNVGRQS